MQMPDMDGRELIEQVRSTPQLANLPLIVLTSIGADISREQLEAWRLAAYLSKPIRQSRLFDAVISAASQDLHDSCIPLCAASEQVGWSSPAVGCQVLVAEDTEINRFAIHELLIHLGLDCTLAENGQQAVDQAASRAFDLVLMDCQMPALDGLAATHAIRRREETEGGWARNGGRLPVIALTANAIAGDREHCIAAGMDDYLTKPIDRSAMITVLNRWLPADHPTASASPAAAAGSAADGPSVSTGDHCFDRDDLLNRCFGDRQMAVELLDMFTDGATRNLEAIDQAVAQRDRASLVSIAHSLKGVASHLSAQELRNLTGKINRDYRNEDGDIDGLLNDVVTMRSELQRCLAAVPPLRQSIAGDVACGSARGAI
ncbi:MAG: hypothetical protein A2W31_00290 [Planctomycetes bacterium RBG_16_64_10]|nr:MAG: hypothetical protein A2W31_00290 [Planctomycetes bacterium RBG_16_64_10]